MFSINILLSSFFTPLRCCWYPVLTHLPNCHRRIVLARFNWNIVYPPPYERQIWHYQKANIDLIKRAINSFDWEKAFSNVDIDKMVSSFSQTIINILCNFIPHEVVLFDDRDPPWMNQEIKKNHSGKEKHFQLFPSK